MGRYVLAHRKAPVKVPRQPTVPIRTRLAETGRLNRHDLYYTAQGSSGGVGCQVCRQHSRLKVALDWVACPCPGPGKAQGHEVVELHGLHYCQRCGRYSTGGGGRGLKERCAGAPSKHGQRVLSRLVGRPPRPPRRSATWPDGTPVEPGGRRDRKEVPQPKGTTRKPRGGAPQRRVGASSPSVAGKRPASHAASGPHPKRGRGPVAILPQASGRCEEEPPSAASLRFQALRERVRAREAAAKEQLAKPAGRNQDG